GSDRGEIDRFFERAPSVEENQKAELCSARSRLEAGRDAHDRPRSAERVEELVFGRDAEQEVGQTFADVAALGNELAARDLAARTGVEQIAPAMLEQRDNAVLELPFEERQALGGAKQAAVHEHVSQLDRPLRQR